MTGFVLALAGLACGDGGPGAGAATAAVTEAVPVKVGARFDGFIRAPGGPLGLVHIQDGRMCITCRTTGLATISKGISLAPDGEGRFRLTYFRHVFTGTAFREGRRSVLTLDPPARPAPPPWNGLLRAMYGPPRKP
jgi:hypothetical protein